MKVGVIGLGRMGRGLAKRFLSRNFEVIGWNRTKEKASDIIKRGLKFYTELKEVVLNADVIFVLLSDNEANKAVFLSEEGIIKNIPHGKVIINASTITPDVAILLSKYTAEKGGFYVDAPVLGNPIDAENGRLIILVGAEKKVFDEVQPILRVIGEKIFYLGGVGKGSVMKLIFNMVSPTLLVLLGEAINLGRKAGLDTEMVIQVLSNGPLKSAIDRYYAKIMNPNPPVTFSLKLMTKDLEYATNLAHKLSMPLFLPTVTKQLYQIALANGFGEEYHAKVYQMLKKLAGIDK